MPEPLIYLLSAVALMAVGVLFFWPEHGLYWRWQRNHLLSERVLSEDALKHIYQSQIDGEKPTIHSLAGALHVRENKAADVLSDLQAHALIEITGSELLLTSAGQEYALRILRAHRLFERYLSEETGYKESEWHNQAHIREHQLSAEEVATLAVRLGNPTHDPHGDPIPNAEGYVVYPDNSLPLTSLKPNTAARITHLEDEPEVVYAQLVAEGLYLGEEIRLLEVTSQRVRFWSDGDEHVLAPLVAANITVVPIPAEHLQERPAGRPLTILKPGQAGTLLSLSPRLRSSERRRLMDLGLLPGTTITAEFTSAAGDPMAFRVRGALIALRKSQSDLIFIS